MRKPSIEISETDKFDTPPDSVKAEREGIRKLDTKKLFSASFESAAKEFEPEISPRRARHLTDALTAVEPDPEPSDPDERAVGSPAPASASESIDEVGAAVDDESATPVKTTATTRSTEDAGNAPTTRPGTWQHRIELERQRREEEERLREKKERESRPPLLDAERMRRERRLARQRERATNELNEHTTEAPGQRVSLTRSQRTSAAREQASRRRTEMAARKEERSLRTARRRARLIAEPENSVWRAGGYALLSAATILTLIQLIWSKLPLLSQGVTPGSLTNYAGANLSILIFAFFIPFWFFTSKWQVNQKFILGSGRAGRSSLLLSFIIGLVSALGLRSLHNIVVYALIRLGVTLPEGIIPVLYQNDGLFSTFVMLLLSSFIPGILLELFFRGLVQGGLSVKGGKTFGMVCTVILSTIAVYQSVFWIVPLGLSLMSGRLRALYDSIKPAMIFHISAASVLVILQNFLPRFTQRIVLTYAVTGRAWFYASIIVLIICLLCLRPLYRLLEQMSPEMKQFRKQNRAKRVAGHPTRNEKKGVRSARANVSSVNNPGGARTSTRITNAKKKRPSPRPRQSLHILVNKLHWSYILAFIILLINIIVQMT